MEKLADVWHVPLSEARSRLADKLASVELFPYHSRSFGNHGLLKKLPSTQLAKNFIYEKVKEGKAIVIVTRQVEEWGLHKQPGVVLYTPQQARGAHLTHKSPGGSAILDRKS